MHNSGYLVCHKNILSQSLVREHSPLGELYHCTAGLQFYKFGFNCVTTYKNIFSFWSKPVLLNWRIAEQWSFPHWWVFSARVLSSQWCKIKMAWKIFALAWSHLSIESIVKELSWPSLAPILIPVKNLWNNFSLSRLLRQRIDKVEGDMLRRFWVAAKI